ncbi:MAG: hypothetical protein H6Q76_1503, partial [Firmicutes bacterium]|nr:hypothetical protein [Bacillota bacterium]
VEAYFRTPSGDVLGVQAKYFFELGNSELGQIDGSLRTALANHPNLSEYWIYIPFDLTGRVAEGRRGKSQAEKFEEWKVALEAELKTVGRHLNIILCTSAVIRDQLLHLDTFGGMRRYWFDEAILTSNQIEMCLEQAKAFAGPRFSGELDVVTNAHDALDFFGGIGDFQKWRDKTLVPILVEARGLHRRCADVLGVLSPEELSAATSYLAQLIALVSDMRTVAIAAITSEQAGKLIASLRPLLVKARELQEVSFFSKHGADKDTPGFRQFNAEYMCTFPAGDMDAARELERLSIRIEEALSSHELGAATAHSLLLVGAAGVGKTHAIVSAAYRRFRKRGLSLIVFGDDFQGSEPWEVIRSKLGFGASLGREALFECIQSCADNTALPFIIYIDALNESPRNARWKVKLPELLRQCGPYPSVKVCVSTRDTYRNLVVDSRFPGYAFEHSGFSGREFEALQAFAAFYGLDSEITPLFAAELSNPLFLHLACKTLKDEGRHTLDVSLPGFSALFEKHLMHSNLAVRERLGYANPKNLVRLAMLTLAEILTSASAVERTWSKCADAIRCVVGAEFAPEKLLHELEHEGLVILTTSGDEEWLVRLGYQRYGDVLRATSLVESCTGPSRKLDIALLHDKLKVLGPEDDGLLEVLAAVLPEKVGVEITDKNLGLEVVRANLLFVRALPWRSRDSILANIEGHLETALGTPGVWQEVYEALFKLSLIPDHRLNAENGLVPFLWRHPQVDRDAYLSLAAFKSFDAEGAVKSLIDAALRADISRWPSESRRLATKTLGWLTSCSDRRVRDRAGKGLARVLGFDSTLAAELAEAFGGCDDDYVLEYIALAIYSACLLEQRDRQPYVNALNVLVTPGYGYDTPNVLVRDTVRLLANLLGKMELQEEIVRKCKSYPERVMAPRSWPTLTDVQPLLDLEHLPLNMDLCTASLKPDFWRYQVESRIHEFDLASAGITNENLAVWVMAETLKMGYPGYKEGTLHYDQSLSYEYGSGRGRSGYAERLGKKYYWIALHRIIGILADNVQGRESYSGRRPGQNYYWSVGLRKCDLTDVRAIASESAYPDEILAGAQYAFPPRTVEIQEWVRTDDLPAPENRIVTQDGNGEFWVAIDFGESENDLADGEDSWQQPYLGVSHYYSSVLAKKDSSGSGIISKLESVFDSSHPSCYRSYLAEYPDGPIFQQCVDEGDTYLGSKGFTYSVVTLSRAGEWEYDYSAEERQEHLRVPCQNIVRTLNLRWDRQRGWIGTDDTLIAFESKMNKRSGFFIRKSALDDYLAKANEELILRRFVNRGYFDLNGGNSGAQIDIFTYVQYSSTYGFAVLHHETKPFNC